MIRTYLGRVKTALCDDKDSNNQDVNFCERLRNMMTSKEDEEDVSICAKVRNVITSIVSLAKNDESDEDTSKIFCEFILFPFLLPICVFISTIKFIPLSDLNVIYF